jgi:hypothetical protein
MHHSSAPSATNESRKKMRLADESAGEFSCDEMTIVLSFLPYGDIMRARVCKTLRDDAKKTLVPVTDFVVYNVRSYNAMRVMSTALPNFQQISLRYLGDEYKYNDGEDAEEVWARDTANRTTLHIDYIILNFRELRSLELCYTPLNGRYPVLFNFPYLQKLSIWSCTYLKWDLEMLLGLPSLKVLDCCQNPVLTGDINSLRVLKDTLEKVKIIDCWRVEGHFMDLADFPHLKELIVTGTNLRGDIRDIRGHNFPALERLSLPSGVHGGMGYKFQNTADVPEFMHAIHLLLKRSPMIFGEFRLLSRAFNLKLSRDSPDWYEWDDETESPPPPFYIQFIQAGSRRGWCWYSSRDERGHFLCEINWLDSEPSRESSDYGAYIERLQNIKRYINFYRGYYQPPTQEEYRRLM